MRDNIFDAGWHCERIWDEEDCGEVEQEIWNFWKLVKIRLLDKKQRRFSFPEPVMTSMDNNRSRLLRLLERWQE